MGEPGNIVAPKGEQGVPGNPGERGRNGDMGDFGLPGDIGRQGQKGEYHCFLSSLLLIGSLVHLHSVHNRSLSFHLPF